MFRRIVVILMILVCFLSVTTARNSDRGVIVGPAPRTEAGGQRWALIIGINDYTNVPALRYGRSDAETLANVLIEKCGFPEQNVVLMTDGQKILSDPDSRPRYPTRGNLRSRINQIAQLAGANDLLLISFAGHGINIDGRGYLIPVDGDSRDLGSLVPLSWIKETLESSPAKQKLLMLDACHSGARAADVAESPAEALLSPLNGAGFATLASCDSQQLSHEDTEVGRGVFTNAIIEGLQGRADTEAEGNRDGVVTANELFLYSSLKVKQWSLTSGKVQTPVLKGEFKGRIELARFKTAEELNAQKEELQKRLKEIQDTERTSITDELQKEIAELETQLNAITGSSADGVGASDDFQAAYARYNSAKKQVEDIDVLLTETLKNYQPTSSTVARIEERLQQAQTDLKKVAGVLDSALSSQIQSKQSVYDELIKDLLPSAPQVRKIQQEIDDLKKRQTELKRVLLRPGDVRTNSIGMKLVYIPADSFMMGSPSSEANRDSDEGPQHRVTISKGFWMGVYEVTQAQYSAVMGNNPSNFKGDNLPVEMVSWEMATEFCRKLSQMEGETYRLPTEAEWEYACRASTQTRYYFGDNDSLLGDYAWYSNNSGNTTHPVGQKKPNKFGLYDMHGNVWEWCQDWYNGNYYSSNHAVDPKGPDTDSSRVLRGGSWYFNPWVCRSAFRHWFSPDSQFGLHGFRVVVLDFQ